MDKKISNKEWTYITFLEERGFTMIKQEDDGLFIMETPRKNITKFGFKEIENIYNKLKGGAGGRKKIM